MLRPDPYHEGERAVQHRAGVRDLAVRMAGHVKPAIPDVGAAFLREQRYAVLATGHAAGPVGLTMLSGPAGFLDVDDEGRLHVKERTDAGRRRQPAVGSRAGLLAIDLATRRRMKVKGVIGRGARGDLFIVPEQAYALCPKYIQRREVAPVPHDIQPGDTLRSDRLDDAARAWIERSDTFFIGTVHPQRGPDAAHRGGARGFVAVLDERRLHFPDYVGNSMFNTLGNLTVNPRAALMFIDYEGGHLLQLRGRARVLWDAVDLAPFPGAQRAVEFAVEHVVRRTRAVPLRWTFINASKFNPPARHAASRTAPMPRAAVAG